MRIKKVLLVVGGVLAAIFLVSAVEVIREELGDNRLQEQFPEDSLACEEAFKSFLEDKAERGDICFCTEKVANTIDHILYRGSKNVIRGPASKTVAKIISLTAFPVCLIGDTTQYAARAAYEATLIPFSEEHRQRAQEHFYKVRRCVLALVTSPSSIVSADLVSQHFVTNRPLEQLIVPYGKLYSAKSLQLYPKSHDDVAVILKEAKRLGKKVTFAGALMSQGKQALPKDEKGVIIHFDYLNQVTIDPEQKRATIGAGARWGEVQAAANEFGLAVKVMQASNIFTVGGSLSINCHGWDHKAGTLKETVRSVLVADGEGEIKRFYPGDELFDLVIGGLGGFGPILEAELSLATNTQIAYEAAEMPVEEYVSYFKNQVVKNVELLSPKRREIPVSRLPLFGAAPQALKPTFRRL